jgi:hypothetical protein
VEDPHDALARGDLHQVKGELDPARQIRLSGAELEDWQDRLEPTPVIRLVVDRSLDQVIHRRFLGVGLVHISR